MTSYRDKTFCSCQNQCATQDCEDRLTAKDKAYLKLNTWMPVSFTTMSDECGKYVSNREGREFQ